MIKTGLYQNLNYYQLYKPFLSVYLTNLKIRKIIIKPKPHTPTRAGPGWMYHFCRPTVFYLFFTLPTSVR